MLQVYLTGMVPLAMEPSRLQHVEFNSYYVARDEMRRFADKTVWRDAIFAHLEHYPELLMLRLWQCVGANHEGRTPPSLDDLVEPPRTPMWKWLAIRAAWACLLLTCFLLLLRCFGIRVSGDWRKWTKPHLGIS